jgi:hypothetical protein
MTRTVEALYDGEVFRPAARVPLQPNTRVRITIETMSSPEAKEGSFLSTARSLNLDGPPDWAANIESYLYVPDKTDP